MRCGWNRRILTQFSHRVAIANRRRNLIESMEVGGRHYEGAGEVESAIDQFYERLFKEKTD